MSSEPYPPHDSSLPPTVPLPGRERQTEPLRQPSRALRSLPQARPLQLPARSGVVGSQPPRRPPPRGRFSFLRSLRWRLALAFVGFLTVALLLLGAFLFLTIRPYLRGEALNRLEINAFKQVQVNKADFESAVQVHIGQATPAFEDNIGSAIGGLTDVEQVLLVDPVTRQVIAGSPSSQIGQPAPYFEPEQLLLRRQGTPTTFPTASYQPIGSGLGVVLVGMQCKSCTTLYGGRHAAIIEVVTDFNSVNTVIDRLMLYVALGMGVLIVIAALVGVPLMRQALRPLTQMTTTAQAIAGGNLSQRVNLPHSGDEIGELSSSFDEMIERIQAAFAAQQESEAHMRQFVADASHELRTPLTSLRGFTDVLLRGAKDDPETADHVLRAMQRECERMSRLVHDLLTLARLDAGRQLTLQPFDLVELVGERAVLMQTDGGGQLLMTGDQDKIKQVLLILLDNALKYGKQGPDGWVRVQVSRSADTAQMLVIDNGRGIAPEDLPHIFERFYRADKTRSRSGYTNQMQALGGPSSSTGILKAMNAGGSGLGLPIAQAIVQAHNGSIWAQSQIGQGTQFTIRLPRQPASKN
jgi:signal transduction histidine kinase